VSLVVWSVCCRRSQLPLSRLNRSRQVVEREDAWHAPGKFTTSSVSACFRGGVVSCRIVSRQGVQGPGVLLPRNAAEPGSGWVVSAACSSPPPAAEKPSRCLRWVPAIFGSLTADASWPGHVLGYRETYTMLMAQQEWKYNVYGRMSSPGYKGIMSINYTASIHLPNATHPLHLKS
jgi:hypothetical protein